MSELNPACRKECVSRRRHNELHPENRLTACRARSPDLGLLCTRNVGHKGEHSACGGDEHDMEVWRDNPVGEETRNERA